MGGVSRTVFFYYLHIVNDKLKWLFETIQIKEKQKHTHTHIARDKWKNDFYKAIKRERERKKYETEFKNNHIHFVYSFV